MRAKLSLKYSILWLLLAVPLVILQTLPSDTLAEAAGTQNAVVEAVQGTAYIVGAEDAEQKPLSQGANVPAWQTVRIDDNSKLLLQWEGNYLTSAGSNSTLYVSTRQIPEGQLTDVQLIEGILRASSFGGKGRISKAYALTTPVATVDPAALDVDVDFIVEVPEPAVTVITVLQGSVKVKNLTVEGSEDIIVKSCQSVFVEERKPVSNAAVVPADALEKLIASTTIAGTQLAGVQVCGLGRVAREHLPAPAPPPDYSYVDDEYVDDHYPYDEIEVYPPEVASGPMIVALPGIGRWYLPYDVYYRWGFRPSLIRLYVSAILNQNTLDYNYYYWNHLAAQRREYYDVLYPAQFARNTILIAQTQRQLDFVRIRQDLLARRIRNLQATAADLEKALPGRGGFRAPVLNALHNSLNSPRNINVARSFRQGVESRLRIQEQLAGTTSDELSNLRRRMGRTRDPRERLQLRDQMAQLRNVISEGKLPLPKKSRDIGNLLGRIPKTGDPGQLDTIQKQLARQLGRPKVMAEPAVVNPKRLERLARNIERTAPPEARTHVDKRLQDLQRNVRQRMEIESTQKEINRVVSQAAKTKNQAKRAELLRKVPGLVKPDQAQLKGPLRDLREQQRLHSRIIGQPEKGRQEELARRMRNFTRKQAEKVRPPVGKLTGELRKKVQGTPKSDEAARKRAADLKKQAEDTRRRAEQRKAVEADRLRKEKDRVSRASVQKRKQEQTRQQRLKKQQAEQARRRSAERVKAQQQEKQLRLKQEQRRKTELRARDRQRQEQIRRKADQSRSREKQRIRAQQREQQLRQSRSQQQRVRQQQQREQQLRQRRSQQQRARQPQMRQSRTAEPRVRQIQRPQQRGLQPRVQEPRKGGKPGQLSLPLR